MNANLIVLFSGFPEHHFNDAHEAVLQEKYAQEDAVAGKHDQRIELTNRLGETNG